MQKKQVKILGYQAENCKIKLFYETNAAYSRYIVEKNRKYELITNDLQKAKLRFMNMVFENTHELKLNI